MTFGSASSSYTDCTKPISTELWLTDDVDSPTWSTRPADRRQFDTAYGHRYSSPLKITANINRFTHR